MERSGWNHNPVKAQPFFSHYLQALEVMIANDRAIRWIEKLYGTGAALRARPIPRQLMATVESQGIEVFGGYLAQWSV